MCGICGIVARDGRPDLAVLRAMNAAIAHRGPDDEGEFTRGRVALAMRRLSVIDVAGGHQPMTSRDGRYTIVYNGETYNFEGLRRDLDGPWRTRSDTEVVLELWARHGRDALSRMNGMFALAVHDREADTVTLARDRVGEKPLYWADLGDRVLFASELRALRPHVPSDVDREALAQYLALNAVPAPRSILRAARKIPPGSGIVIGDAIESFTWWRPPAPGGRASVERTGEMLRASVKARLVSDVPIGVFLSGGLDSSAVAACAVEAHPRVRTFSIGFDDPTYDESGVAARVAAHLGTEHAQEIVTADAIRDAIPAVGSWLDEPLADASILPTYLLCRFARRHVTVALGGDGGDEVMAGYPTFLAFKARPLMRLPKALADLIPASTDYMSLEFKVRRFFRGAGRSPGRVGAVWMGAMSPEEVAEVAPAGDPLVPVDEYLKSLPKLDDPHALQAYYLRFFLGEQVIAKVDRASMAASLEVRAPFLDAPLMEYLWSLPVSAHWKRTSNKRLLKEAMRKRLPAEVLDRPKHGFAVPLAAWFRGPLKSMLTDLLSVERLNAQGLLRAAAVERLVSEHLGGRRDHSRALWALLVVQMWLDQSLEKISTTSSSSPKRSRNR